MVRSESTPDTIAERLAADDARMPGIVDQLSAATVHASAATQAVDARAFASALAEIDAIDHHHRRQQARLRVISELLTPRPGQPAAIARLMCAGLAALTGWLEEEPREPQLVGYAGVLCVDLGLYREAEQLLAAAARLDPALPGIEQGVETARMRRRANATVIGIPVEVKAQLTQLAPRLARIAKAARPADGLTISLCMIVRDEEEMLPRCLEAVKLGVDEIVIVDTGSRDRTVEIAESFGARVLHHEWTGDFSEARNIGLEAATGDWLLWLDADEVFVGDDALRLRELSGRTWREAFYIVEINHTGDLDDGAAVQTSPMRLVRNRPLHRFTGRIHEQWAHHLPGYLGQRFEHTDIRIDHFGYLGVVREERDKGNRNLNLLLQQVEEGDDSAFLHFNLGSEYLAEPPYDQAAEQFAKAWERIVDDPQMTQFGFAPTLAARYLFALRVTGAHDRLAPLAAIIHERFPGFTDVYFEQAMSALDRNERAEARALFERCLEVGEAPARYSSTVGAGTFLAQMRLAQLDLLDDDREAAERRMRGVRDEHPKYFGVIDPFASLLLTQGHTPDEVLAELTHGDHELSPSGWFMVAVNLQERGHRAQAELAFRGALERRPTLDIARIGLADALLVQGRIEEAAVEAEQVPFDKRLGANAIRTALFARLALEGGDELDAQRAALVAELDAVELDAGDRDALRAWAVERGVPAVASVLTRDHVNALTPMLEALLRLGAADAFADLVQVLGRTGLDRRTQREVLATLFLRQGLTELAADEWIAAVQEDGADAAAYAGLAEVARRQGLDDDARSLAAEALVLEPGQPLAGRVLQTVGG